MTEPGLEISPMRSLLQILRILVDRMVLEQSYLHGFLRARERQAMARHSRIEALCQAILTRVCASSTATQPSTGPTLPISSPTASPGALEKLKGYLALSEPVWSVLSFLRAHWGKISFGITLAWEWAAPLIQRLLAAL